jgi:hypothetical protein
VCACIAPAAQAYTVWQWANFLVGRVPDGKQLLLLNLDETGIPMFMGDGRGNVHHLRGSTA